MTTVIAPSYRAGTTSTGLGWVPLSDLCVMDAKPALDKDMPVIGLEHIAPNSGDIDLAGVGRNGASPTGATYRFDLRHVLYGKLRPYLNKVALPTFAGRCTTEIIPLLPKDGCERDYLAWLLRRPETVAFVMHEKKGTRMPRADLKRLMRMPVPVLPPPEQKRVAAVLEEELEAVQRAHAAALAQLAAAEALPVASLRDAFESETARNWPKVKLVSACRFLAARQIRSNGSTQVMAVTTACLSEWGFLTSGVKRASMDEGDVADATLHPGEILIARSNTPGLVGRVAMYDGDPSGVVASDLTIRLLPSDGIDSRFLSAYLSWLYANGYWRVKAAGTSSTMKKITRAHLAKLEIPAPPFPEQHRVVERFRAFTSVARELSSAAQTQRAAIDSLPAALVGQAFAGKL